MKRVEPDKLLVTDAVLERRLELVDIENEAARRVLALYVRPTARINGSLFALYPYEHATDDPRPISRVLVWKITRRIMGHVQEADRHAPGRLRAILRGVARDEFQWQWELYTGPLIQPAEAEKVLAKEDALTEDEPDKTERPSRERLRRRARAAGVYEPLPGDLANEIVNEPAHWDGKRFADRFTDLNKPTRDRLARAITTSLSRGEDMRDATRRVALVLKGHKIRAEMIARTEIMRVSNRILDTFYDANRRLIHGVQCVATLDDRTCLDCGMLDGQSFFVGGDPPLGDAPTYPLHPICRCVKVPISKIWDMLGIKRPAGTRASMFGPVDGRLDMETWLRRVEGQGKNWIPLKVLGSQARYAEWQDGKALSRFVGTKS